MAKPARRSIPPILDDPRTARLTPEQERTLLLLPLAVDDHGRALDSAGTINGILWGTRWEQHPPELLDAELDALADARFVTRYEVEGVRYLQILDWRDQQVISRAAPSLYPAPPEGTRSRRTPVDALWGTVDNLVGVVSGAAEKLHDPTVQATGVKLLSDLAGQIDPQLGRRVRERAGDWIGAAAGATGFTTAGYTSPSSPPAPDTETVTAEQVDDVWATAVDETDEVDQPDAVNPQTPPPADGTPGTDHA